MVVFMLRLSELQVRLCVHCRYLEPEYRNTLALQEMLGFHADVLCLQEVDEKAFTGYFLPHMRYAGAAAAADVQSCSQHHLQRCATAGNSRLTMHWWTPHGRLRNAHSWTCSCHKSNERPLNAHAGRI